MVIVMVMVIVILLVMVTVMVTETIIDLNGDIRIAGACLVLGNEPLRTNN